MNIIHRNFFRLLRAGIFGTEEQIEPMSVWKWRQVYGIAVQQSVAPLLYDGIKACSSQFVMQMPDDMHRQWHDVAAATRQRNLQASRETAELLTVLGSLQFRPFVVESWIAACHYPVPEHHFTEGVNIFFPYDTQRNKANEWAKVNGSQPDDSHKHLLRYTWKSLRVEHRRFILHLNSRPGNMTLQNIIEQERLEGGNATVSIDGQRFETVGPTLTMLVALLAVVKASLSEGLHLWQIADMGMLLRSQGDRVDFVKLQAWIERLHCTRMAQLVGSVLTSLLGFSTDEIPFVPASKLNSDADDVIDSLFDSKTHSSGRFFRYHPGESIASVVANITHRLGNVEE